MLKHRTLLNVQFQISSRILALLGCLGKLVYLDTASAIQSRT